MARWAEDCVKAGDKVKHIDGRKGTVLRVFGSGAKIEWSYGVVSIEHEDFWSLA